MEKPWLRHYETGVPASLAYPSVPLHRLLEETARKYPDLPAIKLVLRAGEAGVVHGGLTYAMLSDQVDRFAAALAASGVQPGDRVGLMLPNLPQFVIAFYGALKAGAIVVNTNPTYTPRELEQQYRDAGVETVVLLSPYVARLQAARRGTAVKRLIVTDLSDYLPDPLRAHALEALHAEGQAVEVTADDVQPFRALLDAQTSPPPARPISPGGVALYQYTGGTTGAPKAAMLTHANLVANALQFRCWLPGLEEAHERVMGALPLFHIYGLTVAMNLAVILAAELIVLPAPRPIEHVLQVLESERATVFPGVPTTYISIINHPEVGKYDLHAIKACISGAAPLPMDVQLGFEEITGGRLVEGYGLTEASPVTHCNPLRGRRKAGAIGLPLPDVEAKIVDPERLVALPPGEAGELWVRGPNVMSGYRAAPEETARAITTDGWLRTGDVARMDAEGYFTLVDRLKDIIIVSGLNVAPSEVEGVLYEHPAVLEAVAIGAPDPYRGETVKAHVVLKPGETVTEAALIAFCTERLAPFKVPRAISFRAELPKSPVGKPLRRVLVEEERHGKR